MNDIAIKILFYLYRTRTFSLRLTLKAANAVASPNKFFPRSRKFNAGNASDSMSATAPSSVILFSPKYKDWSFEFDGQCIYEKM